MLLHHKNLGFEKLSSMLLQTEEISQKIKKNFVSKNFLYTKVLQKITIRAVCFLALAARVKASLAHNLPGSWCLIAPLFFECIAASRLRWFKRSLVSGGCQLLTPIISFLLRTAAERFPCNLPEKTLGFQKKLSKKKWLPKWLISSIPHAIFDRSFAQGGVD